MLAVVGSKPHQQTSLRPLLLFSFVLFIYRLIGAFFSLSIRQQVCCGSSVRFTIWLDGNDWWPAVCRTRRRLQQTSQTSVLRKVNTDAAFDRIPAAAIFENTAVPPTAPIKTIVDLFAKVFLLISVRQWLGNHGHFRPHLQSVFDNSAYIS